MAAGDQFRPIYDDECESVNRYLRPLHLRRNEWTKEERSASEQRRFKHVYEGTAAKAVAEDGSIGGFAAWTVQTPEGTERVIQKSKAVPFVVDDPEVDPEAKARYQGWLFAHLQRLMAGNTHWCV